MADRHIDLEAEDPLKLVVSAFDVTRTYQQVRNNQYRRDYKLYRSYVDMTNRDPDRANISLPKIYSIVETKVPNDVRAVMGSRPWIPMEARREEFRDASRAQTDLLDDYLYRGGFFNEMVTAIKIKTLYGTSFLEAIPRHDIITEKVLFVDPLTGQPQIVEQKVPRLRLRVKAWAPWEIYADPYATGLEDSEDCRFIIKVQIVSGRQILNLAKQGAYGPDFDPEEFESSIGNTSEQQSHEGLSMLADIGIASPTGIDDVGVLWRFESPERYIDCWNGTFVLRDVDNPFNHSLINLSKIDHVRDAHTQNSFWGFGEAKPNEVLQTMLNDTWNQTFDNHQLVNQAMMVYRKGAIDGGKDALVRVAGNKIGIIDTQPGRPLSDYVMDMPTQQLPRDHYALADAIERMMDLTSGSFEPSRGEEGKQKTLGEATLLREAGDSRQELNVKQIEAFLSDFSGRCISHIDQFGTLEDFTEILGAERAQEMLFANPNDIPGGFNYTYKGSDRVINELIKQRNMKELTPMMMAIPNVLKGWWARQVLLAHNLDELEIEEGIIPDDVMFAMQQQQAEREAEAAGQSNGQSSTGGKPGGRSKVNTPGQEATAGGRERTRLNQGVRT